MTRELLQVHNLRVGYKVFDGMLQVLDGIDITLCDSERIGLVGETGCGKTTTAKTVAGVLSIPPASILAGDVYCGGSLLVKGGFSRFKRDFARRVSMIYQDPTAALNPVFTVGTQLMDAIKHSTFGGQLSAGAIRQRALKAFEDVALPDPERILKSYPVQLSGGMRQRVCIAMALAVDSEILIADEPTTSLDVTIQDQVLRLLGQLVEDRETATILISHSLGLVRTWTEHVYVMYGGTLMEAARTQSLFENPKHPYTQGLIAAIPKLTGGGISRGIPGRIPDYLNPPKGCRFSPRCPNAMPVCDSERPAPIDVEPDHWVKCHLYQEG